METSMSPDQEIQKRSREELRKIIRESSRSQFILEEMQRYGFWPKDQEEPTLTEELIREEAALQQDLRKLLQQQREQKNAKAMMRKLRKERMAAAKAKRKETKANREAARLAKRKAWKEKQSKDITFLGESVSFGLKNKVSDNPKLEANGLPYFENIEKLAEALKLEVGQLRWLTYNRKVATTSHYKRFEIPKKTGSVRVISAPMFLLKKAQHWVLENILYKHKIEAEAHGFVPQKSILSNAKIHIGQTLVINMDMKDFFPTITYRRIKGMFGAMGYSEQIATVLALLCSEPETDLVKMDGVNYYVQTGKRHLPQGAPTSPAITNIICRKLDRRLAGVAHKIGFKYSRYADDLTFSAMEETGQEHIGRLLWQVRQIIEDEGFNLHPDKLQIMRKGAKREVTGIVVNEKANISRKKLKEFRAVLYKIEQEGPEGRTWGKGDNLFLSLQSFAAYVAMVNPQKGTPLLNRVRKIRKQYDPIFKKVKSSSSILSNIWKRITGK